MVSKNNSLLSGEFYWFQGVVEDRKDPLKLGRVRVRVMGIHTDDKNLIPTEHLPWANILQNVNSASVSGIGNSSCGLVEGSWVFGCFLDGNAMQCPLILGSIQGISEELAKTEKGFYDPRTPEELAKWPRKPDEVLRTYPHDNHLHESDFHRLARNENIIKTNLPEKEKNRSKEIETAFGLGGKWDEPSTRYDAQYPFNHVFESESGHLYEIDDTPKAERISIQHRKGSFEEYLPDGSKQQRIVKNNYSIVFDDNHVYIKGVCNLTVEGNINILTNANLHLEVKENILIESGKDIDIKVNGNLNFDVVGDVDILARDGDVAVSAENASVDVSGALVVYSEGDTELHQKGNLEIKTEGSVLHTVSGNYQLHVDGEVDIRGNPIHLNKDKM